MESFGTKKSIVFSMYYAGIIDDVSLGQEMGGLVHAHLLWWLNEGGWWGWGGGALHLGHPPSPHIPL